jgi:uncharacterized hydrophobic protein (TIGR00341 family)
MAARLIEVTAGEGATDTVVEVARTAGVLDVMIEAPANDGRQTVRLVTGEVDQQKLLDRIQTVCSGTEKWRIVILPVEATIPAPPEAKAADSPKPFAAGLTREELYQQVGAGARLDGNYLLLVVLSTVVAAIGLAENNVAVVIGAMVIAPLLGPFLAFAFAVAIGERDLMLRAAATSLAGLGLSLALAAVIGFVMPIYLASAEIASRTVVGFDSIALALASGAAAALSLLSGLSSTLVGVMVAVALLPPAATLGIMFGAAQFDRAAGAGLLLGINIVCIILATQITFIAKGVRPRSWFEAQRARRSALLNAGVWLAILLCLSAIILLLK